MNGSNTGVIATAGLREIHRQPTIPNAGSARPRVGTLGKSSVPVAI